MNKEIKFITATLLLTSFLTMSTPAHAGFFSNIAEARRIAEDLELEQSIGPFTRTSLKEIQINVPEDSKWLLVNINQENGTQIQYITRAKVGIQKQLIALNGYGNNDVNFYVSSSLNRDDKSYVFIDRVKINNFDKRDMKFLLPSSMVQSEDKDIVALSKTITAGLQSDNEKVKAINDYIMKNIQYDFKAFYDGSFANNPYDAKSILLRKISVCGGFSNLFAALTRASGVRTKVVNGDAIGAKGIELHAWNEVFLEGKWQSIDVTWNTVYKSYKYYLIDKVTLAKDHFESKTMPY